MFDVPGRMPLPAKITVEVLPPIDLRGELAADLDPEAGYELVTEPMQQALNTLAHAPQVPADRLRQGPANSRLCTSSRFNRRPASCNSAADDYRTSTDAADGAPGIPADDTALKAGRTAEPLSP